MKQFRLLILIVLAVWGTTACNTLKKNTESTVTELAFVSQTDSLSYSLGVSIGRSLLAQNLDSINYAQFNRGVSDVLNDNEQSIDDMEAQKIIRNYVMAQQEKQKLANKKAGEAFLAKNKLRDEVVELESGLQYEIIKEGNGKKPKLTDKVTTHYHGTLIDGTVFDSSVERGSPIQFQVQGVIPGWTEALQLMKTGAKWRLFIPSHLAYGERGSGQKIGPNETLIFEVELISIDE